MIPVSSLEVNIWKVGGKQRNSRRVGDIRDESDYDDSDINIYSAHSLGVQVRLRLA